MIELRRVTYRYPGQDRPILADLDLQVAPGEMVLLAGPSGSGKSTLLRTFNGLVPHFHGGRWRGRATVGGLDTVTTATSGLSSLVAFAFQDPESQFVTSRVEDELAFGLENHGVQPAEIRVRLEALSERLEIGHLLLRPVHTLSGGERQRVALASVLALEPRVLALDEPTSQLDPTAADGLLEAIGDLHRQLGMTVVLAEHRLERLLPAVDRVCLFSAPGDPPRCGEPRDTLAASDLAPPLLRLGRHLGWRPLPLTLEEAAPRRRDLGALAAAPEPTGATPAGPPRVRLEGVSLAYGETTAVAGVDLELRSGEIVALMGPNGSGKSTLLKGIVGLIRPIAGRVLLDGRDVRHRRLAEVARQVGLVPQNPGRLLHRSTVRDEIAFTRSAQRLPASDPSELLASLDLDHLANSYPRDLSVGERQRVAIAAILAAGPEVLLLDEPTRGLDEPAKARIAALLGELGRRGVAVVIATHDAELVARCARRVVLLDSGRVTADGATGTVLASHPRFAPQLLRFLDDPRFLTVDAVVRSLPS